MKELNNFDVTKYSIIEYLSNYYSIEDVEIECFLDKLSEETLEIILKDLNKNNKVRQ